MKEYIFDDCAKHAEKFSGKNIPFWGPLADKYQYENKEKIRSDFRREARRRGYKLSKIRNELGGPKILIFDVETTPLQCYTFNLYPERISIDQIIRDWHLLSYSYKWLFEEEVHNEVLTPKEIEASNDKRLTKSIWELFDKSDAIVAYNGTGFDIKRCNTRFLINGYLPPSSYITVDPIITAKKIFDFSSNKMDYVSELIDGERKIHTNFSLWARCVNGDEDALEEISQYNSQDVIVLENIYLEVLPWIQGHPNWNLYYSDDVTRCPNCGNTDLNQDVGSYKALTNIYAAFLCNGCGYRGRQRKSMLSKEKSSSIVR